MVWKHGFRDGKTEGRILEMEKKRLITRSDFDGLVCAMLLRELDMIDEIKSVAREALEDCCSRPSCDWAMMKTRVRDDLSRMLFQKTKRSPMILPVIMDV